MTAYTGTRALPNVEPIAHPTGICTVFSTFDYSVAPTNGDVITMLTVPAFAVIVDMILSTDELDTNVSATIHWEVGDGTTANRFISSTAQPNSAGLGPTHLNQPAGQGYQYTSNTAILVTCTQGPATGATSGYVRLTVMYSFEAITANADGAEVP